MSKKTFQITCCNKCNLFYSMTDTCPVCFRHSEVGRTVKVVSMIGGAVHDWSGSFGCPAACATKTKSRPVFLPVDAIVTCRFCSPWPMPTPNRWEPSETDKKMARDLPSIDEVSASLLKT